MGAFYTEEEDARLHRLANTGLESQWIQHRLDKSAKDRDVLATEVEDLRQEVGNCVHSKILPSV